MRGVPKKSRPSIDPRRQNRQCPQLPSKKWTAGNFKEFQISWMETLELFQNLLDRGG
jgi:hypothetical protein